MIEKMKIHPFGLLAGYTALPSDLDKSLRSYIALARAARGHFGHGSQWFLNVAKARLVIHVTHRSKGDPHDGEVSGLIAATMKLITTRTLEGVGVICIEILSGIAHSIRTPSWEKLGATRCGGHGVR